jgi:hypothetical protein
MRNRRNFTDVSSIRSAELFAMSAVQILLFYRFVKGNGSLQKDSMNCEKERHMCNRNIHKRFLAWILRISLKTRIIKWINKKQTNSMKPSLSLEATSRSSTQEFLNTLWSPKVHYHVHKSHPLVPVHNKMNPVHDMRSYFLSYILILSSHLCLCLPIGSFVSGSPSKIL